MPVHQFPESDCKTSPLALLVQICSNIGAEKPTTKSSSTTSASSSSSSSSDKANNEEIKVTKETKDSHHSCSPESNSHSASSLVVSSRRDENTHKDKDSSSSSSASKRGTPSDVQSPPLGRSSVECRRTPGSQSDVYTPEKSSSDSAKSPSSTVASSTSQSSSLDTQPGSSSTDRDTSSNYSSSLGLDFGRTDSSSSSLLNKDGVGSLGLGSYKAGLNGLNPLALANCSGCSPVAGHIPLDAASATYPLSAASALKAGGYSFGSGLSPYLNYARMKSASGATGFVPMCRDPYCTNCQLAAQLPYPQDRLAAAAHLSASSALFPTGLSGFLPTSVPGFASPASSLYASSALPRPNVCSWMVGDTYCGKRFASSEELLQHLRTHTSLSTGSGSLPLYTPGVSLPSALAVDAAAACGLYTTPPSLTTPAGLRRTYPTSLSPVSSLSAASRYHPYKPPGLSALPTAPLPPLAHPGLGFYNPYNGVYGKG